MPKKVYINIDKVLACNAIFKYVDSDRSDGKTTKLISLAFDNWKASGKITVLARRWSTEITKLYADTLITNLKKVRETGEITHAGSAKKNGIHFYNDGKEFAVLVPISRASAVKSAFDVATHCNLYIDEYVPIDGRYVKNEVEAILELFRTIDRDTFTNYILVMSNHATESNPIFNYFEIFPKVGLTTYKSGTFAHLRVKNKGNINQVKLSPIGLLTDGTPYGNYAGGGIISDYSNVECPEHEKNTMPYALRINGKLYQLFVGRKAAKDGYVLDYATANYGFVYVVDLKERRQGDVALIDTTAHDHLISLARNARLYVANVRIFEDTIKLWKLLKCA